MNNPFIIIAMDGPAASGKSSTARALAAELSFLHVDTGMHFRAVTWCLLERRINLADHAAIAAALSSIDLETHIHERSTFICIGETQLSAALLRSERVNSHVSEVAAQPAVRDYLKNYQRGLTDFAKEKGYHGLIMEGRDIGSVILPHAQFKFFLHADPVKRARRRSDEDGGSDTIAKRDHIDSTRAVAPLKCPEGAIEIDTSHDPLDAVVKRMLVIIKKGGTP